MASKSSPTDLKACESASRTRCRNGATSSPKPASSPSDWNTTEILGNAYGQTTDRYFGAAAKRRAGRSAGRTSHDPVHRSPAGHAAHAAVLPGTEGRGFAGWAGLGGRAGADLHPQWYPSRCALGHFHPTMNRGERSWTIDEVPLEWCLQPGIKLDFRHFADGYVATAKDVETELKRIGHTLSPLEIVVVNTTAGAKYGRQDSVPSGCGMGYGATMYLLERGVRLTGIDGWSWDAPFVYTAKKYAETRDARLIWEGHT